MFQTTNQVVFGSIPLTQPSSSAMQLEKKHLPYETKPGPCVRFSGESPRFLGPSMTLKEPGFPLPEHARACQSHVFFKAISVPGYKDP